MNIFPDVSCGQIYMGYRVEAIRWGCINTRKQRVCMFALFKCQTKIQQQTIHSGETFTGVIFKRRCLNTMLETDLSPVSKTYVCGSGSRSVTLIRPNTVGLAPGRYPWSGQTLWVWLQVGIPDQTKHCGSGSMSVSLIRPNTVGLAPGRYPWSDQTLWVWLHVGISDQTKHCGSGSRSVSLIRPNTVGLAPGRYPWSDETLWVWLQVGIPDQANTVSLALGRYPWSGQTVMLWMFDGHLWLLKEVASYLQRMGFGVQERR